MSKTNQPQIKRESAPHDAGAFGSVANPKNARKSALKQNLYQALAILVCALLGALIGFLSTRERLLGAFLGGFGGFLVGFLASGVILLIFGTTMARTVEKRPADRKSVAGSAREPILRTVARGVGLTMVLIAIPGISAVSVLGESRFKPAIALAWFFLLAVGLATVYGLKSAKLRLFGAVLNDLLALLGLVLLVLSPDAGDPLLRRMIGAFCLAAAVVNIAALRPPRPQHATSPVEDHISEMNGGPDSPQPRPTHAPESAPGADSSGEPSPPAR